MIECLLYVLPCCTLRISSAVRFQKVQQKSKQQGDLSSPRTSFHVWCTNESGISCRCDLRARCVTWRSENKAATSVRLTIAPSRHPLPFVWFFIILDYDLIFHLIREYTSVQPICECPCCPPKPPWEALEFFRFVWIRNAKFEPRLRGKSFWAWKVVARAHLRNPASRSLSVYK